MIKIVSATPNGTSIDFVVELTQNYPHDTTVKTPIYVDGGDGSYRYSLKYRAKEYESILLTHIASCGIIYDMLRCLMYHGGEVNVEVDDAQTFFDIIDEINKGINAKVLELNDRLTEEQNKLAEDKKKALDIACMVNRNIELELDSPQDLPALLKEDLQFNHEDIETLIGRLFLIDDERVQDAFRDYIR